ncbi:MAG: hypothetical protein K8S99_08835 [Planctomycetes bacterium]|nr:hypothetical protein [Planctomycetota bacterium]
MTSHPHLLRLVHGLYWLCLGGAFGATLMLAVSAAVTFRTVRELGPVLQSGPYAHPALAEHFPGIIAGAATGAALETLGKILMVFLLVVGVCASLQCTLFADTLPGGVRSPANITRLILLVLVVALLAAERRVVSPRVWELRNRMYNTQATDQDRTAARVTFNQWHQTSTRLVGAAMLGMAAAVLVSAFALHSATPPTAAPQLKGGIAAP